MHSLYKKPVCYPHLIPGSSVESQVNHPFHFLRQVLQSDLFLLWPHPIDSQKTYCSETNSL